MNEKKDLSLKEKLADDDLMLGAINRGVRGAVLAHARAGNPVAAWQDGKVVWVQPEQILSLLGTLCDPTNPVTGSEMSPEPIP
jgi:hypothetical protein